MESLNERKEVSPKALEDAKLDLGQEETRKRAAINKEISKRIYQHP